MMYDLQKAGMWKRISAFLFDIILLAITVLGLALVLSSVFGYDNHTAQLDASRAAYEAEYGVDFDISSEDYAALTDQQRAIYDEARVALATDDVVIRACTLIINLTLIIITFSILLGYLILEFLVPLLFGNGQTLGKKIFGIAVMRADGIRLSPMLLFARTVLGKCTVETLLPVLIVIMIFFASMGITAFNSMLMLGLVLLAALPIVQLLLLAMTPARTPIHDKLAQTVTVDFASQMIFDSPEAMLEYKQRIHTERANGSGQQ
jgi:uncharacterized RDD family membrane protein YckC